MLLMFLFKESSVLCKEENYISSFDFLNFEIIEFFSMKYFKDFFQIIREYKENNIGDLDDLDVKQKEKYEDKENLLMLVV